MTVPISVQLRARLLDPPDRYSAHGLADSHVIGVGSDAFGFSRSTDLARWIEDTKRPEFLLDKLHTWADESSPSVEDADAALLDFEKDLRIIGSTPELRAALGRCVAAAREFFGSGVKMIGYGLPGPPGSRGNLPGADAATRLWVQAFDAVAAVGYCQSNWGSTRELHWLGLVESMAETSLTYAAQFGLPVYWMLWHKYDAHAGNWREQPTLLSVDPDLSRTWKVQLEAAERHGVAEVLLWNPEDSLTLAEAIGVMWLLSDDGDGDDTLPPGDGLEDLRRQVSDLRRLLVEPREGVLDRLDSLDQLDVEIIADVCVLESKVEALESGQRSMLRRVIERVGRMGSGR